MFSMPGKQAVTLTQKAVQQINALMDQNGHYGLRLGVKKGGCAGMEYTLDYVDEVTQHDEVIEQDGARVLIAPMAQMFLFGTEIDYEVSLLEAAKNSPTRSYRSLSEQADKWPLELEWRKF